MSNNTEYQTPIDANRLSIILDDYTTRQSGLIQWFFDLIVEKQWTLTEAGKRIGGTAQTSARS
jgi:hypothetical protein